MYHGPREHVVEFFEQQGFVCPERKGVADFLQEVTSRKDQKVCRHATHVAPLLPERLGGWLTYCPQMTTSSLSFAVSCELHAAKSRRIAAWQSV